MRFLVYIAVSLDGYVATPDGGVGWLDAFGGSDYGYSAFIDGISSAVVGRATYDQAVQLGWPYQGIEFFVLTSSPLTDPPPHTVAWAEPVEALVRHLSGPGRTGDCWVLGGPRTIRAFAEIGALHELHLFVMPVVLGAGIPLFPSPYPRQRMDLVSVDAFETGVVRLVYGTPA